jgi:hypothetical protein
MGSEIRVNLLVMGLELPLGVNTASVLFWFDELTYESFKSFSEGNDGVSIILEFAELSFDSQIMISG